MSGLLFAQEKEDKYIEKNRKYCYSNYNIIKPSVFY